MSRQNLWVSTTYNKHDEHNVKYSDNKVYLITTLEIGETES